MSAGDDYVGARTPNWHFLTVHEEEWKNEGQTKICKYCCS